MNSLARAISLAATLSVVAFSLLTQPAPAVAATGAGTLFGLGPSSILSIDPVTGASSTFVSLPAVDTFPGASFNDLTSDAVGHRLFTQRTVYAQQPDGSLTATYQVVTIDTADQTVAPTVSGDMPSGVTQLVYDPASQSLFGQTSACCPFQLVRIDPASGAQTHVADIPGLQPLFMTVAPARHTIYIPVEDFSQFPAVNTIVSIDTSTGAVSQSQPMAMGIFALEYDSGSGLLYGKTFCCPSEIVKVDPTTGGQTQIATNLGIGSGITIDSGSQKMYMTDDELGAFGFSQFIQTVDLKTGAVSTSPGALPAATYVGALAFEGVAITPDSIISDVDGALTSGNIQNAGVATALVAELTQAKAARSRGDCTTAANIYRAFINDVTAQSGRTITPATADQLVAAAQFLIANCP